mgnify:CR=1 FL=1
MSNIGNHIKKIDDLNLNSYDFHYIDVHENIERLKKDGSSRELGKYVSDAARNAKQIF